MSKPHTQFQASFKKVAELMKCSVHIFYDVVIPRQIWYHPAMSQPKLKSLVLGLINTIRKAQQQSPCDCILTTPHRTYCIEIKVGNDSQLPHQATTERLMNRVNPFGYYVVRKWEQSKKGVIKTTVYDVIQGGKNVERFYELSDVIQYFKEVK